MYPKSQKLIKEFVYDFSVLGGATGNISLIAADPNGNLLPEGFIIEQVMVKTDTALTSGGTPTITVGNTGDADGYLVDIYAAASAVNSVVRSGEVAGALLWDDTNDHEINYRVNGTAANQDVIIAIGTAAVTAGKFRVIVEGQIPSSR